MLAAKHNNKRRNGPKRKTTPSPPNSKGGTFRFINQGMYTMTSKEYMEYVHKNKDLQLPDTYHAGFEAQAKKWPSHPLNHIIATLDKLPANQVIFDVGAGSCKLWKALNHKHTIVSVDYAPPSTSVVLPPKRAAAEEYLKDGGLYEASASDLTFFPDNSADIIVFCLSLMSTDWPQFLVEADRLLKPDGLLIIAEISSRIESETKLKDIMECNQYISQNYVQLETYFFIYYMRKIHGRRNPFKAPAPDLLRPCIYK